MITFSLVLTFICLGCGLALGDNPLLTRRGQNFVVVLGLLPMIIWLMVVFYLTVHNYQG